MKNRHLNADIQRNTRTRDAREEPLKTKTDMGIKIITTESEKALEAKLVEKVKEMGGLALKFTSQFHRGIPDRIVLLPYHTFAFVELKTTGRKPEPLQVHAIMNLEKMGYHVFIIDSTESLNYFLAKMQTRIDRLRERSQNYSDHCEQLKVEALTRLLEKYGEK